VRESDRGHSRAVTNDRSAKKLKVSTRAHAVAVSLAIVSP
jgi:hypothetical protein